VHPARQLEPVADWNAFAREWVASHGLSGALALLVRGPSVDRPHANHAVELIDLGTPTSGDGGRS
jgi:pyruvate kinase